MKIGIAIITEEGNQLTYSQLNKLAESLSVIIKRRFSPSNKPSSTSSTSAHLVGIMMERDIGFIASILATLKAGGTYVPVDPSFPPDRSTLHIHLYIHIYYIFYIVFSS